MSVVILFDGTPVNLPESNFPEENLMYDIYGFLWRFSVKQNLNGIDVKIPYRYYRIDDFKYEDRRRTDVVEGYYDENQYQEYSKTGSFAQQEKVNFQQLIKFDFKKYFAKVDDQAYVETLYDGDPYLYYFYKIRYRFPITANKDGKTIKNYKKEIFINSSSSRLEIDIPENAISEKIKYAETSSPEGVFFSHNFRGHFAYNSSDEALTARYKHVFSLISFQIHFIVTDIFEGKFRKERIIDVSQVDENSLANQEVIFNLKGKPLEYLIFLLKKSWCYYVDPSVSNNDNFPHKQLPEAFLTNSDIDELYAYYYALYSLYNTLYILDLATDKSKNKEKVFFDLLSLLHHSIYTSFPYDVLIYIIDSFVQRDDLSEDEEQTLVKTVIAISKLIDKKDVFLDYLLTVKFSDSLTNYEVLYNLLDDARLERYTIINWFGNEQTNRKFYVYAIHEIWKNSIYDWSKIDEQNPSNEKHFWDENADLVNKNVVVELISSSAYTSNMAIEVDAPVKAYDLKSQLKGKFVEMEACIGYDSIITYSSTSVGSTIQTVDKSAKYESLGKYHVYQPVTIINCRVDEDLDSIGAFPIPIFLLSYVQEYEKLKDFDAGVDLAINLAVEAGLFFLTGGASTLSSLRHLRNFTTLGKALFSRTALDPMVLLTARRGLWAAGETVSVGLASLTNIATYLTTVENDPEKRKVWEKTQQLMLLCTMFTAGVAIRLDTLVSRAADDAYTALKALPSSVKIDKDVYDLIELFHVSKLRNVNKFDDLLIENKAMVLRNWLFENSEMTDDLRKLFVSHYGLLRNEEISMLNDLSFLKTWLSLAKVGMDRPLKQLSVLVDLTKNNRKVSHLITLYKELGARNAFENLDLNTWQNVLDAFIYRFNISETLLIARQVKLRPQLYIDLMRSHFGKVKRGALDKLQIDDILNIMKGDLKDVMIDLLIIKNTNSLSKISKQFNRSLKSRTTIPIERISALKNGTAEEMQNMHTFLKSDVRDMNVLLSKTQVYKNGELVQNPSTWDVYLSGNNPQKNFKDDILPSFIKNLEKVKTGKFNIFNAQAVTIGGYHRNQDTEMKFIFNFLEESWDEGDHFVIELESTLGVCSSCQAYLGYLFKVAEKHGKTIEIHLKDNAKVESFNIFK